MPIRKSQRYVQYPSSVEIGPHADSLKERESLLTGDCGYVGGASSLQWDQWREPLGCGSHRQKKYFIPFFKHLSQGKNGRLIVKLTRTIFLVKSRFDFSPRGDSEIFLYLFQKQGTLPNIERKQVEFPKEESSGEDFLVIHPLSVQIYRYHVGKYTETFIDIPCQRKIIRLIKNLHSCKKEQLLQSRCQEAQSLSRNRQQ